MTPTPSTPPPVIKPQPPFWQQPWFQRFVVNVVGGVLLTVGTLATNPVERVVLTLVGQAVSQIPASDGTTNPAQQPLGLQGLRTCARLSDGGWVDITDGGGCL